MVPACQESFSRASDVTPSHGTLPARVQFYAVDAAADTIRAPVAAVSPTRRDLIARVSLLPDPPHRYRKKIHSELPYIIQRGS